MSYLLCLLFSFLLAIAHADEEDPCVIPSTPEQIADLKSDNNLLINNILSPISGQLCIRKTDLIAKGAQNIELKRTYIAPYIPVNLNGGKNDDYQLYKYLQDHHQGWVFLPHLYLKALDKSNVRFTDPKGISLEFHYDFKKFSLLPSQFFGISNFSGDIPSAKYDPRNTQIQIEQGGNKLIVSTPDGSVFHYAKYTTYLYLLRKEILPNGKILRYHFDKKNLTSIESFDPQERYRYTFLTADVNPKKDTYKFLSPSGQTALYHYTKREKKGEVKIPHGKIKYHLEKRFLQSVESPLQRAENFDYCPRLLLQAYNGKDTTLTSYHEGYNDQAHHFRVQKLFFPVGPSDGFHPVHELSYIPAIAGKKEGATTVKNADGTTTTYFISKNLTLTTIRENGENGQLKKEKKFHWTPNQWLQDVELRDGNNQLLYRMTYNYDAYGNPTSETFAEDLTGNGHLETYMIRREYSQDGRNLLLREEEETGKITVFEYLPNTNLPKAKLIQNGNQILLREFWDYDDAYNLIRYIRDDGNTQDVNNFSGVTERHLTYDILRQQAPFLHMPERRIEKYLEDGSEKPLKTTCFKYDNYGNIAQEDIYDANGQLAYSIFKTYDEFGNLLSETNPLGQKAIYTYDEKNRCKTVTPFSQKQIQNKEYDRQGRLLKEHDRGDQITHTTSYVYDFHDRLIQKMDPYQNPTYYDYDRVINKVSRTEGPPICSSNNAPLGVVTSSTYNAAGYENSKTDANGNTTYFRNNAYGSPTEIIYPNGGKEFRRYERNGLLKSQTDPDDLTIAYTYDILGRVLTKTYLSAGKEIAQESFHYNSFHLSRQTDREGNTTYYTYDGAGRKTRETIEGHCTDFTYDLLGRLKSIQKNNLVISYQRDLLDRIVEETQSDGGMLLRKISYTYDEACNRKTITRYIHDQEATETFVYDAFDRLVESIDSLGYRTKTMYEERHQNALQQYVLRKTTLDPLGITTTLTYDAQSNLVKKEKYSPDHMPLSAEDRFYDPSGYLVLQNDHVYENHRLCSTQTTTYSYNDQGKMTQYTRAAYLPNSRTTLYSYTPEGKLATKTLPSGIILEYTYDPLGYLRTTSSSDHSIEQHYIYNRLGYLLEASDLVQKTKIQRKVDPFGNIEEENYSTGLTLKRTYDHLNRPLSFTLPDNSQINFIYDSCYLREVSRSNPLGELLYTHTYGSYDLSGRLISETLPYSLGVTFHAYEPTGRKSSLSSPFLTESNAYDPLGNLISRTLNGTLYEYTYDGLSQLCSESSPQSQTHHYDSLHNRTRKNFVHQHTNELNELLAQGDTVFKYDLNGNLCVQLTPEQETHMTFDALNRLLSIQNNTHQAHFTYDALGRRLSKQSNEETEYYLYHGTEEIGAFASTSHPKQLKISGLAHHAIAIELDGAPYIPFSDTQGNIRQLIDPSTRSTVQSYNFTAFGERLDAPSIPFNPWTYAAKRLDPEFNLIYFGHRYYNPALGRWLSIDPAGSLDSMNLYQYLFNNPLAYIDPDGQCAVLMLPLLVWGAELVVPSLSAMLAPVIYTAVAGAVAYGGYKAVEALNSTGHNTAFNPLEKAYVHKYAEQQKTMREKKEIDEESILEKRSTHADPDPLAEGNPHTVIERPGPEGKYTTFNPDGSFKQYRGSGKPHGDVARPNVKENEIHNSPNGSYPGRSSVRPARPDEIPQG